MVERSIRIREARGSIPRSSRSFFSKKLSLVLISLLWNEIGVYSQYATNLKTSEIEGELAQMVERSLSMREVRGSMPRFSRPDFQEDVHFTMDTEQ